MTAQRFPGSIHHPSRRLASWVLLWFAFTCMAAVASPWLQPQGATLVCTAAGEVRLVSAAEIGSASDNTAGSDTGMAAGHHALDCVLCLPLLAPPAAPPTTTSGVQPARKVLAANFDPFFPRPGYSKLAARGPPGAV
jgi:hypothetical protein